MRRAEARALLYALAATTGLRRGELSRLRWQDLDLEQGLVSVRASSSKSRTEQVLPLRSDLLETLREDRARRSSDSAASVVFRSAVFPGSRTFARDLLAAGLAKEERVETTPPGTSEDRKRYRTAIRTTDESGRVVDFHALRVTYVTSLMLAGVHPREAQAPARHSDIRLTMRVYTDPRLLTCPVLECAEAPRVRFQRKADE